MEHPSDTLLARYLAGDCLEAETTEVERWAAEHPANQARLEDFRTIQQAAWPPVAADVDAMWAGVRRTMRADHARSARFARMFRTERRRWWRMPIAAAAAIALVAGATLAIVRTSATSSAAAAPMREYRTPRGQRATFQLSDGTRLILAAASRLRVPANYGSGVRDVYLDGEAFFDVVHDAARPFRVRAKDAVAEDIGTRFDVRAYAEDSVVAVAVAEGAVALGKAGDTPTGRRPDGRVAQGVMLRRGDVGTLAPDGRVTTGTGDVAAAYLAWTDGHLHFVETPLPEVVRAIGRWYDLDLRLEGAALAARTVTADFGTQGVEEMVRALALAVDARVSRSGRVVTLYPKS